MGSDMKGRRIKPGTINAPKWDEVGYSASAIAVGDLLKVVDVVGNYLQMAKADGDDASDVHGQLYVAMSKAAAAGQHFKIARQAVVTFTTTGQAVGDPVYMSATAGGYSFTPVGSHRKVGHVIKVGDSTTGKILVSPGSPGSQSIKMGIAAVAGAATVTITAATLGGNFGGRPVVATPMTTDGTKYVVSATWSTHDLVITFSTSFTGNVAYAIGLL